MYSACFFVPHVQIQILPGDNARQHWNVIIPILMEFLSAFLLPRIQLTLNLWSPCQRSTELVPCNCWNKLCVMFCPSMVCLFVVSYRPAKLTLCNEPQLYILIPTLRWCCMRAMQTASSYFSDSTEGASPLPFYSHPIALLLYSHVSREGGKIDSWKSNKDTRFAMKSASRQSTSATFCLWLDYVLTCRRALYSNRYDTVGSLHVRIYC